MDLSQGHMGIVIIDHTMGLQRTSSSTVSHTLRIMQRLMAYSSQVEYQDKKRMDIQLLPTHTTKRLVWREYIKASRSLYIRTAGYHSFCKIWKKFLSHSSSSNQNLTFSGYAREITELSAIQLIYLRV